MIKTTAIILASAASLGASTTTPPALTPTTPAHFEVTAGPIHIIRENGETQLKLYPNSETLLKIELSSGKTLNIKL